MSSRPTRRLFLAGLGAGIVSAATPVSAGILGRCRLFRRHRAQACRAPKGVICIGGLCVRQLIAKFFHDDECVFAVYLVEHCNWFGPNSVYAYESTDCDLPESSGCGNCNHCADLGYTTSLPPTRKDAKGLSHQLTQSIVQYGTGAAINGEDIIVGEPQYDIAALPGDRLAKLLWLEETQIGFGYQIESGDPTITDYELFDLSSDKAYSMLAETTGGQRHYMIYMQ